MPLRQPDLYLFSRGFWKEFKSIVFHFPPPNTQRCGGLLCPIDAIVHSLSDRIDGALKSDPRDDSFCFLLRAFFVRSKDLLHLLSKIRYRFVTGSEIQSAHQKGSNKQHIPLVHKLRYQRKVIVWDPLERKGVLF